MKKNRSKHFYTLVELLMAMAIFAIISVIMMRFFSSAQQIWSKASQKNVLYADARVALDIMTAELQNAMYDNNVLIATEPNITPGIYPFWFEYKDFAEAGNPEPIFGAPAYVYDAANPVQQATYNKNYVTQLNFISATALKPHINASNICEIKYLYLPVRLDNKTDDNPTGVWNILPGPYSIKGGVLVRVCTGNLTSGGVNNFDATTTACLYNFLLLPHDPAAATRVRDIFTRSSSENYTQIIDGVVDMKITCYTLAWNGATYELKAYNPMKHDGTISVLDPLFLTTNGEIGTIVSGTPFPVAVKIDLYMLAERDMHEWLTALNSSLPAADRAAAANKIKNERMRCFSKTIYLSGSKQL